MSAPDASSPWEVIDLETSGPDERVSLGSVGEFALRDLWELLAMQGMRFLAPSGRNGSRAQYLIVGSPLPTDGGDDLARLIASEFVELERKLVAARAQAPRPGTDEPDSYAIALRKVRLPMDASHYHMRGGCLQVDGWCGEGRPAVEVGSAELDKLKQIAAEVARRSRVHLLAEHWSAAGQRVDLDRDAADDAKGVAKSLASLRKQLADLAQQGAVGATEVKSLRDEVRVQGHRGNTSRLDQVLVVGLGLCTLAAGVLLLMRDGRAGYHTVVVDRLVVGVPREGATVAMIVGGVLVVIGLGAAAFIVVRMLSQRRSTAPKVRSGGAR